MPASLSTGLRALIGANPAALADRRRVFGTLCDQATDDRRDIHALMAAFDEGIPGRLAAGPVSGPDLDRESQRLTTARGVAADLARAAVATWAVAILPAGAPVPLPAGAPVASAPVTGATPVPQHGRAYRILRIVGPLLIAILGLIRLLASFADQS